MPKSRERGIPPNKRLVVRYADLKMATLALTQISIIVWRNTEKRSDLDKIHLRARSRSTRHVQKIFWILLSARFGLDTFVCKIIFLFGLELIMIMPPA